MDTYPCPKGHQSTEPDFCSECGAKINGGPSTPAPAAKVGTPTCPDCGAPRHEADVIFCEVCGFNYATGAHGEIPMPPVSTPDPVPPSSTPPPPEPGPTPAPTAASNGDVTTGASWTVTVTVDMTKREPGSPEPPSGIGPFTFKLDKPVSLVGRRSPARAIDPEIQLDFDDAVSHRHAVLTRGADGSLLLRDVGSSNGTELNGAIVPPMTDHPLRDGDQLTLGHWTRIFVKAN